MRDINGQRAKPAASDLTELQRASKAWYTHIDGKPTVHARIEGLATALAEARRAEREQCLREAQDAVYAAFDSAGLRGAREEAAREQSRLIAALEQSDGKASPQGSSASQTERPSQQN